VLFNVGAADEADSRTCIGAVLLTGDLRTLACSAVVARGREAVCPRIAL